jgi:hypothetical protein
LILFTPCELCKSNPIPGYILKDNTTVECECLRQYNSYSSFLGYLKSSEIPEKYIEYSINSYFGEKSKEAIDTINQIISNIEGFVKNGFQLYISGEIHTQKTSVACYIAKKAALKGITVFYITLPSLINLIKTMDFSKDPIEKEDLKAKLDRIRQVGLLVLDDAFDERKVYLSSKSSYYLTYLEDFFRYRLDGGKSIITVSNKKRNDISNKFGKTLIHLLNKDCIEVTLEDALPEKVMNEKLLDFLRKTK